MTSVGEVSFNKGGGGEGEDAINYILFSRTNGKIIKIISSSLSRFSVSKLFLFLSEAIKNFSNIIFLFANRVQQLCARSARVYTRI